jgi:hypothetical protein
MILINCFIIIYGIFYSTIKTAKAHSCLYLAVIYYSTKPANHLHLRRNYFVLSEQQRQSTAVKAAEAIVMGIAPDGGLFVPDFIPRLKNDFMTAMSQMTYQQRAEAILTLYLTDFTADENRCLCQQGLQ